MLFVLCCVCFCVSYWCLLIPLALYNIDYKRLKNLGLYGYGLDMFKRFLIRTNLICYYRSRLKPKKYKLPSIPSDVETDDSVSLTDSFQSFQTSLADVIKDGDTAKYDAYLTRFFMIISFIKPVTISHLVRLFIKGHKLDKIRVAVMLMETFGLAYNPNVADKVYELLADSFMCLMTVAGSRPTHQAGIDSIKKFLKIPDDYRLPDWIVALLGLLVSVMTILSGSAVYFKNSGMGFLKSFTTSLNDMKSFSFVSKNITDVVKGLFDFLEFSGDEKTRLNKIMTHFQYADNVMEAIEYNISSNITFVVTHNDYICQNIKKVDDLIATYHNMDRKSLTPQLRDFAMKLQGSRKRILDLTHEFNVSNAVQQLPTTIYLHGKPGVGKSYLTSQIIKGLSAKMGKTLTVYERNPLDEFWSGYCGQDVVVLDDFGSSNNIEGAQDLMRMFNTMAFRVKMADLEDKGMFFRSVFLIISSNHIEPQFVGMNNQDALWRRRHFVVTIDNPGLDNWKRVNPGKDISEFPDWDTSMILKPIYKDPSTGLYNEYKTLNGILIYDKEMLVNLMFDKYLALRKDFYNKIGASVDLLHMPILNENGEKLYQPKKKIIEADTNEPGMVAEIPFYSDDFLKSQNEDLIKMSKIGTSLDKSVKFAESNQLMYNERKQRLIDSKNKQTSKAINQKAVITKHYVKLFNRFRIGREKIAEELKQHFKNETKLGSEIFDFLVKEGVTNFDCFIDIEHQAGFIKHILLVGEPGVGKTTLAEVLSEHVIDEFFNQNDLQNNCNQFMSDDRKLIPYVLTTNLDDLNLCKVTNPDIYHKVVRRCNLYTMNFKEGYDSENCFEDNEPWDSKIDIMFNGETLITREKLVNSFEFNRFELRRSRELEVIPDTDNISIELEFPYDLDNFLELSASQFVKNSKIIKGNIFHVVAEMTKVCSFFNECSKQINSLLDQNLQKSLLIVDNMNFVKKVEPVKIHFTCPGKEMSVIFKNDDMNRVRVFKIERPMVFPDPEIERFENVGTPLRIEGNIKSAFRVFLKHGLCFLQLASSMYFVYDDIKNLMEQEVNRESFDVLVNPKERKVLVESSVNTESFDVLVNPKQKKINIESFDVLIDPKPKKITIEAVKEKLATIDESDESSDYHTHVCHNCKLPFKHKHKFYNINHDYTIFDCPREPCVKKALELRLKNNNSLPVVRGIDNLCLTDKQKEVVAGFEACVDGNFRDVLNKVCNNIISLDNAYALMITGHLGVCNDHSVGCENFSIKIKDTPYNCVIIKRIKSKDLAFFTVDSKLPRWPSVLAHIRSKKDPVKLETPCVMSVKNGDKCEVFSMYCKGMTKICIDSNNYEYLEYSSNVYNTMTTQAGDCGSPIIAVNPMFPKKLLGIHAAASYQTGYCANLLKEDFDDLLDLPVHQSGNHFVTRFDTYAINQTSFKVFANCVFEKDCYSTNMGNSCVVGTFKRDGVKIRKFDPGTTTLRLSPWHNDNAVNYQPAIMHKGDRGCEFDPKTEAFKNYANVVKVLPEHIDVKSIFKEMAYWFANKAQGYPIKPRVLTKTEAINRFTAMDASNPMYMHSSAGFPYCMHPGVQFKTPMLKQVDNIWKIDMTNELGRQLNYDIDFLQKSYANGENPMYLYDISLKDELRPIEKIKAFKTRTIMPSPLNYTIFYRQYMHGLQASIMTTRFEHPIKVGMRPNTEEWDIHVLKSHLVGLYGFDGDVKGFDWNAFKEIVEGLGSFWSKYAKLIGAYSKNDRFIIKNIYKTRKTPIFFYKGHAIIVDGKEPSGDPGTATDNSLMNLFYNFVIFVALATRNGFKNPSFARFMELVNLWILGDDIKSIVSALISDWYNFETVKPLWKSIFDIEFTAGDKTEDNYKLKPWMDLVFLKRKSSKPEGCHFVVGALIDEAFDKMLNYCKVFKSKSPNKIDFSIVEYEQETISQTVDVALLEASLRGKEFYKNMVKHFTYCSINRNIAIPPIGSYENSRDRITNLQTLQFESVVHDIDFYIMTSIINKLPLIESFVIDFKNGEDKIVNVKLRRDLDSRFALAKGVLLNKCKSCNSVHLGYDKMCLACHYDIDKDVFPKGFFVAFVPPVCRLKASHFLCAESCHFEKLPDLVQKFEEGRLDRILFLLEVVKHSETWNCFNNSIEFAVIDDASNHDDVDCLSRSAFYFLKDISHKFETGLSTFDGHFIELNQKDIGTQYIGKQKTHHQSNRFNHVYNNNDFLNSRADNLLLTTIRSKFQEGPIDFQDSVDILTYRTLMVRNLWGEDNHDITLAELRRIKTPSYDYVADEILTNLDLDVNHANDEFYYSDVGRYNLREVKNLYKKIAPVIIPTAYNKEAYVMRGNNKYKFKNRKINFHNLDLLDYEEDFITTSVKFFVVDDYESALAARRERKLKNFKF